MRRILGWTCGLLMLSTAVGCGTRVDIEAEKIELLRIHLADVNAHLDGDVDTLMETVAGEFMVVGDGRVDTQLRAVVRDFFTAYLEGAAYEKYEDLMVPHAEVSDDATMGWVISRMAVIRNEPAGENGKQTRAFTYAGIMAYQKVDGRWQKVANVSTFER